MFRDLYLSLDRLPNLGYLGLDEKRVCVSLGVIFYQNFGRLLAPVVGNEESGGLGKEANGLGINTWT